MIITEPPTKVRRNASLSERMRSDFESVVMVIVGSFSLWVIGGACWSLGCAKRKGAARKPPPLVDCRGIRSETSALPIPFAVHVECGI